MPHTVEIRVPDLGDYHDVAVIEVMAKPGDALALEQSIIAIESEKATMEVPSTAAGVLRELRVNVGATVNAGDVIALVEVAEGDAATPVPGTGGASAAATAGGAPVAASAGPVSGSTPPAAGAAPGTPEPAVPPPAVPRSAPSVPPPTVAPPIDERRFQLAHASPSVRRLARELGVDLGRVQGTGVKGRVTAADVKGFVKSVMQAGGSPVAAGGALPTIPPVDFAKFGPIEIVPLNRIKRISGPRLHAAWVNVPHVTQHDDCDATDLETLRKLLKRDADKVGVKLTPLAFIVKACVQTLQAFPDFNASLDPSGQHLVHKRYWHIGFATDTPNGLVVPVIRDADQKSVFEIARALTELSQKARDGKLMPLELQGGTFTISSLGGIGGTYFTPIVAAPEVAILGVSRSRMTPVWDGSAFVPRLMLPLSLSYDHRVIDGAAAARFTKHLGEVLAEVRGLVL